MELAQRLRAGRCSDRLRPRVLLRTLRRLRRSRARRALVLEPHPRTGGRAARLSSLIGALLLFEIATLLGLGSPDRWTGSARGRGDGGGAALRRSAPSARGSSRDRCSASPCLPRASSALHWIGRLLRLSWRRRWRSRASWRRGSRRARRRPKKKPATRKPVARAGERRGQGERFWRSPWIMVASAVGRCRSAPLKRSRPSAATRIRLPLPGLPKIVERKNGTPAASALLRPRPADVGAERRGDSDRAVPSRSRCSRCRHSPRTSSPPGPHAARPTCWSPSSPTSASSAASTEIHPGPVVTTFEFEPARRGQGQPDRLARGRPGAGAARAAHPHPRADPRQGRGRRRDPEPAPPNGVSRGGAVLRPYEPATPPSRCPSASTSSASRSSPT